jgi:LysM repeat protein
MDKALAIGQHIKIPLVAANFAQTASKAADEVYVPVYHIVQEKEWMYRLSVNYKAPVYNLEKWNNVNKDQVKQGMKMIVGYLKVKTGQSALASKGSATMKTGTAAALVTDVATAPVKTVPATTPAEVKTEPATTDGVNKTEPVKQETKITPAEPVKTTPVVKVDGSNGGYFKSMYDQSGKSNSGTSGVFKSTSGWQDGKYYALMNTVPVGTIIKVTSSDKVVYAKVLGQLAEMKENSGLSIRLSDAAAAQLGAAESTRFNVDIRY